MKIPTRHHFVRALCAILAAVALASPGAAAGLTLEMTNTVTITATSAVLRVKVVTNEEASAQGWLYWGLTNFGTNATWPNTNALGAVITGAVYTVSLSGLTAGTTYWATAYATNGNTNAWAGWQTNFNTLTPYLPTSVVVTVYPDGRLRGPTNFFDANGITNGLPAATISQIVHNVTDAGFLVTSNAFQAGDLAGSQNVAQASQATSNHIASVALSTTNAFQAGDLACSQYVAQVALATTGRLEVVALQTSNQIANVAAGISNGTVAASLWSSNAHLAVTATTLDGISTPSIMTNNGGPYTMTVSFASASNQPPPLWQVESMIDQEQSYFLLTNAHSVVSGYSNASLANAVSIQSVTWPGTGSDGVTLTRWLTPSNDLAITLDPLSKWDVHGHVSKALPGNGGFVAVLSVWSNGIVRSSLTSEVSRTYVGGTGVLDFDIHGYNTLGSGITKNTNEMFLISLVSTNMSGAGAFTWYAGPSYNSHLSIPVSSGQVSEQFTRRSEFEAWSNRVVAGAVITGTVPSSAYAGVSGNASNLLGTSGSSFVTNNQGNVTFSGRTQVSNVIIYGVQTNAQQIMLKGLGTEPDAVAGFCSIYAYAPMGQFVTNLVHFEDGDGDTSPTNHVGVGTWNCAGSTRVSTTLAKVGSGSLYCDRATSTSICTNTAYANFKLGTNDWTVEMWINVTNTHTGGPAGNEWYTGVGAATGFWYPFILNYNSGEGGLKLVMSVSGTAADISSMVVPTADFTTNVWHHIAVTRKSGTGIKVWFDGTNKATFAALSGYYENSYPWALGGMWYNGSAYGQFNGYIDEFRLSTFARYTTNFVPSTTAYPLEESFPARLKVVNELGERKLLSD